MRRRRLCGSRQPMLLQPPLPPQSAGANGRQPPPQPAPAQPPPLPPPLTTQEVHLRPARLHDTAVLVHLPPTQAPSTCQPPQRTHPPPCEWRWQPQLTTMSATKPSKRPTNSPSSALKSAATFATRGGRTHQVAVRWLPQLPPDLTHKREDSNQIRRGQTKEPPKRIKTPLTETS